MFFDNIAEIERIAKRTGAAIFVVPRDVPVEIKNAIILKPEEKTAITIEQAREVIARLGVRQVAEQYIIIRPAELMNEEAANALLKNLEEPKDKVHFVLITDTPFMLLPTILSRAAVYFLKGENVVSRGIRADEKTKEVAKRLMTAKPAELVGLAEEIAKKKDGVRSYALSVVGAAIEMLYKTYFITGKEVYMTKLPKFLQLYDSLSKNGHVKLQIVSNLC